MGISKLHQSEVTRASNEFIEKTLFNFVKFVLMVCQNATKFDSRNKSFVFWVLKRSRTPMTLQNDHCLDQYILHLYAALSKLGKQMLPAISIPEVFPLGLQEERPLGAKLIPLPEFECCDLSPRVSSGPSACSMASRYVHALLSLMVEPITTVQDLFNSCFPRKIIKYCSSSEVEGINDLLSFRLPGGSKSTNFAQQYDQSLLIKQQQRYLCEH